MDKFDKLRGKLEMTINKYGLNSEKTKKISEKFEELINSYYKNEIQYHEDSIMYINYKEAIKTLKNITKEFSKFPTIDEWNKYAKEHDEIETPASELLSQEEEISRRATNYVKNSDYPQDEKDKIKYLKKSKNFFLKKFVEFSVFTDFFCRKRVLTRRK